MANPRRVRLITDSTRKDDRLGAKTLARMDPKLLPHPAPQRAGPSGSDGDPGTGSASGSADDVSQCRAGINEVLRGAFGKLRHGLC